ncbi:MAG: hypothetical protein ACXWCU_15685 [Caldimonas sp.]
MSFRVASPRLQRRLLPYLLLALALAQTLGAMHRIVHSPLALQHGVAKAVPHGFAALFAGHASEQGCDAYDQLSHADLLPATTAALPPAAPVDGVESLQVAWQLAGPRPGFLARGPPLAG